MVLELGVVMSPLEVFSTMITEFVEAHIVVGVFVAVDFVIVVEETLEFGLVLIGVVGVVSLEFLLVLMPMISNGFIAIMISFIRIGLIGIGFVGPVRVSQTPGID